jgi:hypothetical protein
MWASTPLQPGDGLVAHSEQRCETREEADKPASDLGLWASEPTTRHEEMLLRRDQVLDGYAASAIIRYPGEQNGARCFAPQNHHDSARDGLEPRAEPPSLKPRRVTTLELDLRGVRTHSFGTKSGADAGVCLRVRRCVAFALTAEILCGLSRARASTPNAAHAALTGGNRNDVTQLLELLERVPPGRDRVAPAATNSSN